MPVSVSPETAALAGLDPESRKLVLDTMRQLRRKLLTKENVLEWDKTATFPEKAIRKMLDPDIGLQLLFIPEAYGGIGGGARDCCVVTQEMAKICLGVATAFFAIQLGADPLLVAGTEAQKEKWLGAIADGNALVAYAVTEPDAGSNLASLQTTADPVTDDAGEIIGYTVNGNKQFVSTGGYADFITLLAKTPEGPTFFVVEKGTKGFQQGKGEEKHGIRASNTSPLSFSDVFVPVENVIGGIPGKGLKQANEVFGYTRLMVASMALGAGEAALNIVIPYAKERVQFGSTLSEKQGYTHKLVVPHAVRLEAADAYIDEVAIRFDSGETGLEVEGSIAKYFATEVANKTADDAMQALGGYGYIAEYEVEKIKRDVKITCIYEGTSEIQQSIISTFRWRTTRKTKGRYYADMQEEMAAMETTMADAGCRFYGLAAQALNETITVVHENRLTRRQYVMFALADMMTYVEVGIGLARRAKRMTDAGDAKAAHIRAMSRIFANEASELVLRNTQKILMGTGIFSPDFVAEFIKKIPIQDLTASSLNIVNDMDQVADTLFRR